MPRLLKSGVRAPPPRYLGARRQNTRGIWSDDASAVGPRCPAGRSVTSAWQNVMFSLLFVPSGRPTRRARPCRLATLVRPSSWSIRMPRTDKYANPFTGGSGMRLAGLVEQAGEVLPGSRKRRGGAGGRPRWADRRDRLRQSADGPPWRPGLIEGADTKVLTVRDGRFVLAHLRTGTYTVNFSHPYLAQRRALGGRVVVGSGCPGRRRGSGRLRPPARNARLRG